MIPVKPITLINSPNPTIQEGAWLVDEEHSLG